MFSDIPPALQHTFMECCRNRESELPLGWRLDQIGDCYRNSFNVTQQSQQQSMSNWQIGDLSATQQRYVSDTLVISGCNPLIPNAVCLQNPNNPNMFHSYNIGKDECPPIVPHHSLTAKETKEAKKREAKEKEAEEKEAKEKEAKEKEAKEKEAKKKEAKGNQYCEELCRDHIEKAIQEICKAMQVNPHINRNTSTYEERAKDDHHIFPKWRRGSRKHSKDKGRENGSQTNNDGNISLADTNYKLLLEKIDIWAKINCRMIRDLSKQISENKCCQCKKHEVWSRERLPIINSDSDDAKPSKCYEREYVVCRYEETTNAIQFSQEKTKSKKFRFLFWKNNQAKYEIKGSPNKKKK